MAADTPQFGSDRENSVVVNAVRAFIVSVGSWVAGSLLVRALPHLRNSFDAAWRTSRLTRWGRTLARWIRGSYGYRWLTAEPEPEIIVIDLRETWTVGPFIRVLDWALVRVERFVRGSRLFAGSRATVTAFRQAPIRLVSFVLCAAVLANTVLVGVAGSVGTIGLLLWGVLLLLGLAGTQVRVPASVLAEARTVQLLIGALKPPNSAYESNFDSRPKE